MVHRQQQDVIFFAELQDGHAQQWAYRQIEPVLRLGGGETARLSLSRVFRQLLKVSEQQIERSVRRDNLRRLPFDVQSPDVGAQESVPRRMSFVGLLSGKAPFSSEFFKVSANFFNPSSPLT